jgi:hypothetical protein
MDVPYPSEYRLVPRRPRRPSFWLLLAAVAVALSLALAWPHSESHAEAPPRPTAVVHHQPAAKPAAATVTVGKTAYACTPEKPAKPAKGRG